MALINASKLARSGAYTYRSSAEMAVIVHTARLNVINCLQQLSSLVAFIIRYIPTTLKLLSNFARSLSSEEAQDPISVRSSMVIGYPTFNCALNSIQDHLAA